MVLSEKPSPQSSNSRDQNLYVSLWLSPASVFGGQPHKAPLRGVRVPPGGLLGQDWIWARNG